MIIPTENKTQEFTFSYGGESSKIYSFNKQILCRGGDTHCIHMVEICVKIAHYIDSWAQVCINFSALAMESLQSCIKPWTYVVERDDVIKWEHFLRYWPFVLRIHRSPVNSPHRGQWRGALMFSLICARINGWVNDGEAGDLRRHRAHYDVIVMKNIIPLIRQMWLLLS